jgi:hypothetical protein
MRIAFLLRASVVAFCLALNGLTAAPLALGHDTRIVTEPSAQPTITLVRHPYLQQVTATSAVIVWATRENGIADVRYDRNGVSQVAAAQTRLVAAATTGMGFDYYQHEATLTGLAASTQYSYTPSVDGIAVSSGDLFVTAPLVGTGAVRFIAFGDSGVGSIEQQQLSTRMAAERFDFALHTGDVAYGSAAPAGAGGYPQLHSWFFDVYRAWLRTHPMYPSIGNHDNEANNAAPFRDLFVLPRNGASSSFADHAERYYSFDYGPAHIVVLDTELAFQNLTRRQVQLEWLEKDLAATDQPWKIAVFHRSPYSAGGEHGSDFAVRGAFGPIFDRHHVDLVLSGHEHDYERTIPIRETADGGPTTYVVTGGGGAKLYAAATAWWTAASRSAFHYMRGSIDECRLSLDAVGLDSVVFDTTTIDKCTPTPTGPTPFGGTIRTLPGTVQAEHFDDGGAGVAYRDTTAGNSGAAYRPTDVDLQATTDSGAGYNVGWIAPSEWLAYSVDVPSAATYRLELRVAANGPGGRVHVEFNGADKTGAMTVPNTGGWQNWTTIGVPVALSAGVQQMRLVFDAAGSTGIVANVNYIRVVAISAPSGPMPYGGTPASVPGLIEAEHFDEGGNSVAYFDTTVGNAGGRLRQTDVDIQPCFDVGGGYNIGWTPAGEWLSYTIEVAEARPYTISTRVGAIGTGGRFHIEVDGIDVTGSLTVPNTGNYQKYASVVKTGVSLPAGRHVLRLVLDAVGTAKSVAAVNWIRVE